MAKIISFIFGLAIGIILIEIVHFTILYFKPKDVLGEYTYEEFALPNDIICYAILMNEEPLGVFCPCDNEPVPIFIKDM